MHGSWVTIAADAMELLGGGLAILHCLGVRHVGPRSGAGRNWPVAIRTSIEGLT
jgi:hypothetical protein